MARQMFIAGTLLFVSSPAIAGTISMSSTPYPDSVVVTVTIADTGGAPVCGWLALTRDGQDTFFYIKRQVGSTITRRFVDTNVEHDTLYCYRMALRLSPAPIPCPLGDLCDVFDCFYDIATCVNTGPDPAFLGRGYLRTEFPDGTEIDHNEVQALLYPCSSPEDYSFGLHAVPADAAPYLDTAQALDVYGTWVCCWAQGVWLLVAEVVSPQPCVIAVEEKTWGRVKSIYRE